MTTPPPPEEPASLPLSERLGHFFQRLAAAPGAKDADEALSLLCRTIDEVEDQYSGIPKRANPGLTLDGRMYPPQGDYIERLPDGALTAETRGNQIEIDRSVGIVIRSKRTKEVVFRSTGAGDPT